MSPLAIVPIMASNEPVHPRDGCRNIAVSPAGLTPAAGIAANLSDRERISHGNGGLDRLHRGVCRLEAASVARGHGPAGPGVASLHRHVGPPAVLRRPRDV